MIGKSKPVLDHGYVKLIDVMGTDEDVVAAARVSYARGTKTVSDDIALINYLMRHSHTSPFEQVVFKFELKVPLAIWQQFLRHRTASLNQESHRYSEVCEDFYQIEPNQWRGQGIENIQGSEELADQLKIDNFSMSQSDCIGEDLNLYKCLISNGVAREQARFVLPSSLYTRAIWTMDLHNLLHFLKLRLDSKAQYEFQLYAQAISEFVQDRCPLVWQAFENYVLNSVTFSQQEQRSLSILLATAKFSKANVKRMVELHPGLSKGEKRDLLDKLEKIVTYDIDTGED